MRTIYKDNDASTFDYSQVELLSNINNKSRLKKNAQFYNYKDIRKKAILVYINPTGREVDELIDECPYSDVRGFLHSDGTTYAWDGQFLHSEVKKYFPEINSPVHFDITRDMITIYITPQISNAKELGNYLKSFNLSNYGVNGNTELFIDYDYYKAPEDSAYDYNNENYLGIDSFIKLSDNTDLLNGYDPFMDEEEKKQYENII